MSDCCSVETQAAAKAPAECPRCGKRGRKVDRLTVKALATPAALMRLAAPEHRFCATADCPVVHFGQSETLERSDLTVPVFQKEPAGARTVCYCFGVSEAAIREETARTGRSTASHRITDLVQAGRCACELKNPQGSCLRHRASRPSQPAPTLA
jgi:hypothetical protein